MTNFTWQVRDRNVVGLSEDPGGAACFVNWSADPILAGQSLPWPEPEYPTLLIYGIGVTVTTSAVAASRRLSLTIDQTNGGRTEWLSSGTQAASLVRRWEPAVGYALDTTLASSVFREPLPRGFMLLPGLVGQAESHVLISLANGQVGDVLGPVTVRGLLLYP